jgi:hypothetical protein
LSKVTVKVLGAYVDGHGPGSEVSIDERTAEHLVKIGYVKRVEAKVQPKSDDKPKKPKQTKSKAKPKKSEK